MKTNNQRPIGTSTTPGSGFLKSVKALALATTVAVSLSALGAGAALAGPSDKPDLIIAMPTTWASHGPVVNSNFAARVAYSLYDQLVRRDWLSSDGGNGR